MSRTDAKQRGLIRAWRSAANEATTADAAVTYTECADALERALAVTILTAICEGCGAKVPMPTTRRSKVNPDLPRGWSQCGRSRYTSRGRGVRLAAWCQSCQSAQRDAAGSPQEQETDPR